MDHSEQIDGVADNIIKRLIKGEMVWHGNLLADFYTMREVEEFISCDSDLCEERRELLVEQMKAIFQTEFGKVDAVKEVRARLVDFYTKAVGDFALSVATKVFNHEAENSALYE